MNIPLTMFPQLFSDWNCRLRPAPRPIFRPETDRFCPALPLLGLASDARPSPLDFQNPLLSRNHAVEKSQPHAKGTKGAKEKKFPRTEPRTDGGGKRRNPKPFIQFCLGGLGVLRVRFLLHCSGLEGTRVGWPLDVGRWTLDVGFGSRPSTFDPRPSPLNSPHAPEPIP